MACHYGDYPVVHSCGRPLSVELCACASPDKPGWLKGQMALGDAHPYLALFDIQTISAVYMPNPRKRVTSKNGFLGDKLYSFSLS